MMMKMLKMAVIVAVLAFGVTAMAGQITINHAGGPIVCTLTGQGIVFTDTTISAITCVENLTGTPPPGCTNNAPSISVLSPPTSATVGTQITAAYSASDPDGQPVQVTANVKDSIDTATWTWTPTAAGTQLVTLTASDGQTCNSTASTSFSVNVTGGTVPVGAELLLPIPAGQVTAPRRTIEALGKKYYYFVLPGPEAGGKTSYNVQVALGTWDWYTNQDMIVKLNALPTDDDFISGRRIKSGPDVWYALSSGPCAVSGAGGSNERAYMTNVPPGTYYIMVRNTCSMSGTFMLYYSAN